jgi:hypothetical protein
MSEFSSAIPSIEFKAKSGIKVLLGEFFNSPRTPLTDTEMPHPHKRKANYDYRDFFASA